MTQLFDGALPDDLVLEFGDPREPAPTPFPEESQLVANAVRKRQLEFSAGRHCARSALRRLGLIDQALLIGPEREPLWPAAIVGSISHTEGLCAAVVGWQTRYVGVGIDLERAQPLEPEVARRVAGVLEMELLAEVPPLLAARLVFSAKESFYKCQFYCTRAWLDFFDVFIELEPSGGFTARLLVDAGPLRREQSFRGTWRRRDGYLFTAICMPRASANAPE